MKALLQKGTYYLRRFGVKGMLARYILYKVGIKTFVQSAHTSEERTVRRRMLRNFLRIHTNIPCGHSPFQFVDVAKYLFDLDIDGPIVECGCGEGGSTAKLSIIAKETNRRLFVCDSFEKGMPPLPEGMKELTYEGTPDVPGTTAYEGKFSIGLHTVKANVSKYGCIEVCEFIPGFFKDSLPTLDIRPALVITDVVYVSSARDCLISLWPRLKRGGIWFTHDAIYNEYLLGTFDPRWWLETFSEAPPLVMGAGSGLSVLSPSLAYFKKHPIKYTLPCKSKTVPHSRVATSP